MVTDKMTAQTWVLRVDGERPVTSNEVRSQHWRKVQPRLANFRGAGGLLARELGIPACEQIAVRLYAYPPDKRRRDASNLMPTMKAMVDGLVDAGVVPDDTAAFVVEEMPRLLDDGDKRWRLDLHVSAVCDHQEGEVA